MDSAETESSPKPQDSAETDAESYTTYSVYPYATVAPLAVLSELDLLPKQSEIHLLNKNAVFKL